MPLLIPILLFSQKDDIYREIDVARDMPVAVGRSRRKQAFRNALFDSAVVSKAHAEFKHSTGGRSVTITDKRSTHGTRVNGRRLEPYKPHKLCQNDIIKFGVRLRCGKEQHDGITVTFRYNPTLSRWIPESGCMRRYMLMRQRNEEETGYEYDEEDEPEEAAEEEDNGRSEAEDAVDESASGGHRDFGYVDRTNCLVL